MVIFVYRSREEFEKVDIRRTLKRSASERDSQSAVSGSNVCCISIDDPTERRFASGYVRLKVLS